jgi:hypothetical protein
MNMRLRAFPDHGLLVWIALSAGTVAWITHLMVLASVVEYVHDHHASWIFHVTNAGAVAVALAAMALCWVMVREGADDEGAGTPAGRIRFLGLLGLLINGINLLLIVAEGTYVFFIRTSA